MFIKIILILLIIFFIWFTFWIVNFYSKHKCSKCKYRFDSMSDKNNFKRIKSEGHMFGESYTYQCVCPKCKKVEIITENFYSSD